MFARSQDSEIQGVAISPGGGLAVQCFLPRNFYIEGGALWQGIFAGHNTASMVRPSLKAGYKLF